MIRRFVRLTSAVLVIAAAFTAPVLMTSAPASADTVVNGCTIVANPTATNFTNCPGVDLGGAVGGQGLSGVNLSFADLANATFFDEIGGYCPPLPSSFCPQPDPANLTNANLTNANLTGVNFTDVNLTGATFTDANLTNANLTNANLANANLTGATLAGATVTGTLLVPPTTNVDGGSSGAVATWATPQSLPGATPGACTPPSGSLFPLGDSSVTCDVLDDHGGVATGTFEVAVNQVTTSVTLALPAPVVTVGTTVTYSATVSPLSDPNFALSGGTVAFTDGGSPIAGCSAVPLPLGNPSAVTTCTVTYQAAGGHNIQANYSGADVALPNSSVVDTEVVSENPCTTLAGCDLQGLNLSSALFDGDNLTGTDLSGANLTDARMASVTLTDANLSGATLIGAFMSGSNLTGADLSDANLSNPDLSATYLTALENANLTDANLTGANLTGTDLLNANVTGTVLLPPNQTVTATSGAGAVVTWPTPTAAIGVTLASCTPASGSTFPFGTTTVTCQVDTTFGNTGSGTFQVTVNPNPNPSQATTRIGIPAAGSTVSGNSWLDAAAGPGVAKVVYEVSGGSVSDKVIATATPTSVGWLAAWDSTIVANGTYNLQSVATDNSGSIATSAPVSISVSNAAPTTTIGIPSNGAIVTGFQWLDSSATIGITSLTYQLNGGSLSNDVISGGTATSVGWLGGFDSGTVPNGTYSLTSVACYSGGVCGTSAPITITVSN